MMGLSRAFSLKKEKGPTKSLGGHEAKHESLVSDENRGILRQICEGDVEHTDESLDRFLRAFPTLEEAADRLALYNKFVHDHGFHECLASAKKVFEADVIWADSTAVDKDGLGLLFLKVRNHLPPKTCSLDGVKTIFFLLEYLTHVNPNVCTKGYMLVSDYHNFSLLRNFDHTFLGHFSILMKIVSVMPTFLAGFIHLNTSTSSDRLIGFLGPILGRWGKMIHNVHKEELSDWFNIDLLPTDFGGRKVVDRAKLLGDYECWDQLRWAAKPEGSPTLKRICTLRLSNLGPSERQPSQPAATSEIDEKLVEGEQPALNSDMDLASPRSRVSGLVQTAPQDKALEPSLRTMQASA